MLTAAINNCKYVDGRGNDDCNGLPLLLVRERDLLFEPSEHVRMWKGTAAGCEGGSSLLPSLTIGGGRGQEQAGAWPLVDIASMPCQNDRIIAMDGLHLPLRVRYTNHASTYAGQSGLQSPSLLPHSPTFPATNTVDYGWEHRKGVLIID